MTHFIDQMISNDLTSGLHQEIITRFPPEPNGFLHIGHAKSICLNFGIAQKYQGRCFLRFDDTNPCKEEQRYAQSIIDDVSWLGFHWCDLTHASDYYEIFYECALSLIDQGLAYVDSLSMEELALYRGTFNEPGKESPYRNRSIAESKDLFSRMRGGEFPDGAHVLRARIDMNSGNLNMRDPILYRIRHVPHQRTGDAWCIYPMYDFAHPISDALEQITHSLCTLEFQDHRPLYDWLIAHLSLPAKPVQTEFARLNLSHTITSKRKLLELVEKKCVDGWDDPRMPTISGMRQRGYPPAAIRAFSELLGVSKSDSLIDMSILESCVRHELNQTAKRAFAVISPLKIVIENYPEAETEFFNLPWHSGLDPASSRLVPFSRELFIESTDFMAIPSKGYFRLSPGTEVRLRHAYIIRCHSFDVDEQGVPHTLYCSYDKETLGKNPTDRKVKGVIHWLSAQHAVPVDVYQYDRLFLDANPGLHEDMISVLNPNSSKKIQGLVEPGLLSASLADVFQFERIGYYAAHEIQDAQVKAFHRIVDLKDSWSKSS